MTPARASTTGADLLVITMGFRDMALGWYVVATKTGCEDTAIDSLMSQMYQVFAPKIVVERHGLAPKREWAFSGYVFVQFDPLIQAASSINYAYGVSKLVSFGNVLATISDHLMDILKARFEQQKTIVISGPSTCPKAGESVIITSGPFRGVEAVFLESDGKNRSMIMLSMLGTQHTIKVDNSHIS